MLYNDDINDRLQYSIWLYMFTRCYLDETRNKIITNSNTFGFVPKSTICPQSLIRFSNIKLYSN